MITSRQAGTAQHRLAGSPVPGRLELGGFSSILIGNCLANLKCGGQFNIAVSLGLAVFGFGILVARQQ